MHSWADVREKDLPKQRDRQEPSVTPAADPGLLSPEAVLRLQRTHGNRWLVQRMQTTVPVKTDEDEGEASDTEEELTPLQPLSPHDQKVAADLEKITAPHDEHEDLDPTKAAQALAGLGLQEEPKQRDEIADMEETLRLAAEFGIEEKSLQGYKKELISLKVKRILENKDASIEEMDSLLKEGEGLGLPKGVLDPLRLPILKVNLQNRCSDLRGQVQPLLTQAQQLLGTISPLNDQVNQLYSIIMLHPKPGEAVMGCRNEAKGLQQQLNAAHGDFEEAVTEFTDIFAAVSGDMPLSLTALKKRETAIGLQKDAFAEQKANFETAKTTHKKAIAADGAVNALSKKVKPCFDDLCSYYLAQEPYVVAYNTEYGDEWRPYSIQLMQLKGLHAQPLTLVSAKGIVKAIKDLDFTVSVDDYLKEFKAGYDEWEPVKVVMARMLSYKKKLFRTYPTKGKIGMQHLLDLNLIGLKHKGSYRDTAEKKEKKGEQYGPFSRAFWVKTLSPSQDCEWVVHVHYHSNEPGVRNTKGNIDKMHAKTKDDEYKKGAALADWTHIDLLKDLVTATAIDLDRDQKGGVA